MGRVALLAVPYDSGHRALRMGAGPLDLLRHGAAERAGCGDPQVIEGDEGWQAEVATTFALNRRLAATVRGVEGRLPVVLAGNCAVAVGMVAGLDPAGLGVLWLDAHGDLHTPETTASGFLDGMALSMVTGTCWRTLAASVPGFAPIPAERVALVGARDLDPPEVEALSRTGIARLGAEDLAQEGPGAAARLVERLRGAGARRLYLHVDLDVHDPRHGRVNAFAAPGGLSPGETRGLLAAAAGVLPLAGAALTAYDPAADEDGRVRRLGLDLLEALAELA